MSIVLLGIGARLAIDQSESARSTPVITYVCLPDTQGGLGNGREELAIAATAEIYQVLVVRSRLFWSFVLILR